MQVNRLTLPMRLMATCAWLEDLTQDIMAMVGAPIYHTALALKPSYHTALFPQ